MPTRFNEEKILYFASKPTRLHVCPSEERRDTTLWRLLRYAKVNNHLTLCGQDDSGEYYELTPAGRTRLEELQAEWRERKVNR